MFKVVFCKPLKALNPGLNLTRVSFSFVQKHFHGLLFLRAPNHQLVDEKNSTKFTFEASTSEFKFCTNPGLS